MGWLKKFGPAQNILGPVKGQGISRLQLIQNLAPSVTWRRQFDIQIALKEVAFIAGKSENKADKKIFIRFSIDNSIANISFVCFKLFSIEFWMLSYL